MKIELSKSSMKFLESLDEKTSSKIKDKIKFLITSIENSGVLPYNHLILNR